MCQAIVLLFDVTKQESFSNIEDWLRSILSLTKQRPHLFLVGNKVDDSKNRLVSRKLALQLAKTHGLHFQEVSAKTGKGVSELVDKITLHVLGKPSSPTSRGKCDTLAPPKGCVGCIIL